MKQLDNFTMSEVIGHIADRAADEFCVSKTLAKKLVIDALSYTLVVHEVLAQISYILYSD